MAEGAAISAAISVLGAVSCRSAPFIHHRTLALVVGVVTALMGTAAPPALGQESPRPNTSAAGMWVAHQPLGLAFKRKVGFDFKGGDTARWSVTTTEPLGDGPGTITGTHDYEFTRRVDGAGVTEAISIDGTASANGISVPESDTYPGVGVPVTVEPAPDACG
jgi:hypothetical protein